MQIAKGQRVERFSDRRKRLDGQSVPLRLGTVLDVGRNLSGQKCSVVAWDDGTVDPHWVNRDLRIVKEETDND